MAQWYKVEVFRAHKGAGSQDAATACIFVENINRVLDRYRTMPGVKRNIGSKRPFPNIFELSHEKGREVEQEILHEGKISLEKAKKTWYYTKLI